MSSPSREIGRGKNYNVGFAQEYMRNFIKIFSSMESGKIDQDGGNHASNNMSLKICKILELN